MVINGYMLTLKKKLVHLKLINLLITHTNNSVYIMSRRHTV